MKLATKAWLIAGAASLMAIPAVASAQITGAYSAPRWDVVPGYKAPRTSWGKPDISGNWTNSTLTPEQRQPQYGNRLILTKEETAKLEGASEELIALGNKPTDPNAKVTELPADCSGNRGNNCNYNAAFTDPGASVMRVGGQPRSSLLTTADGRVPPRKAGAPAAPAGRGARPAPGAGAQQAAADGFRDQRGQGAGGRPGQNDNPEGRSLGERCILSFGRSGGPPMFDQLYNSNYQFVLGKDHLAIWVEMVHDVRVIPIVASKAAVKHRTDGVRPWFGDSVAYWDGETLVVETTNIPQRQAYQGAWENLTITEKFTRVSPYRMNYKFEVNDPTVWDTKWGGEYEFGEATGAVYEYACHEGNYGLQNILAGAREEDRQAAEKASTAPRAAR